MELTCDELNYPDKIASIRAYFTFNFRNPVGSLAPDFTLPTTDGNSLALAELHPGDPAYLDFIHPTNYEEKLQYAKMFADLSDLPVAVDTFDQKVLGLYDKIPNHCFVLNREGEIVFKAGWASASHVGCVLDQLLEFE